MPCTVAESSLTTEPIVCLDSQQESSFSVPAHGLQQEGKYIPCEVTKGVFFFFFLWFPGNISTGVKQEVSSVSSHGPESGASAQ